MRIGNHSVKEHFLFLTPLLGFIAIVWMIRLIAGALNFPINIINLASVTAATAVSAILAVLLIHVRNFGGYVNVVIASTFLTLWGHLLIIAAIAFAVLTETTNIYVAPEFSVAGDDPLHIKHMLGHITFALGGGSLMGAIFGCSLFFVIRRILPLKPQKNFR
ncbi:MAG: hypothetical protein JNN15_03415 [Blastocatellia bacterium]|nr:hypothetical protein [Blastocatellia bacterium]